MQKYVRVYMTAWMLLFSVYTFAATQEQLAQQQLQQNVDAVLSVVRDKSLNEQQRISQIERYADQYLDYERISALAVGLPWRQFTAQQRRDFSAAFKNMIVRIYAHSALMGASNATVKVLPKVVNQGNNKLETFTEIVSGSNKHYTVGYQMYYSDGVFKIYNFRVNGTSLVTVYRSQFDQLIQQQGIDATIAQLRDRGVGKIQTKK
ncbi:MAG: ABC transporter substrate-binding protein [Snodgrassella sp.]|uniref:MlaC/ttg2D family ABC transporter substrate-binding protein n=1 Tax=Snodgrassella communis TaxID=2946699 RepID=UPI000C1F4AA0|nr:ABC transporter substrate-binding protein [Snodgrassella communis]MCO6516054.1 ABC transporter substrate-binding protein [Snodgrassella sp.]PIT19591.1 toluene tolerance protein [Snodgrassella communis]